MNRTLLVLTAVVATDTIGFGIVIPLLPFFAEALGASPLQLAVIIASFPAMQLVSYPVAGRLSDRFGRKGVIAAGLCISAGAYLMLGVADSVPLLLVSRVMAGLGGTSYAVAQAFVADRTNGAQRTSMLGKLGGGYAVGLVLGPLIGGYASLLGFGFTGFIAAAISLCSLVLALCLLPRSGTATSAADALRAPVGIAAWIRGYTRHPLSLLVLTLFLTSAAFEGTMSMLALFLERRIGLDAQDAGLLWAWSGAVVVTIRLGVVGPLAEYLGDKSCALFGLTLLSCGVACMLLTPDFRIALLGATLLAAGYSLFFPAVVGAASRLAPEASQGSMLGGFMIFGGLGRTAGPLVAGWTFQSLIIDAPLVIAALGLLVATGLAIALPAAVDEETVAAGATSAERGEQFSNAPPSA